jgi:Bacterial regulatory helix-turn-helix protein, lysR family
VDLDAVRTFVAVTDAGRFAEAADDLSITQQAVSKRIAVLERDLGVRLFTRTARGTTLTTDGPAHEFAAAFGLTIDVTGPHFGTEPLLDVLAGSPALATFVGEQTHLLWPAGFDLRRVTVRGPTPVYPHSLICRSDNPHPALTALRGYLGAPPSRRRGAGTWTPAWARRPGRTPRAVAGP